MNKTVIASDYVTLDSNVHTGGGTDVTDILQSLLDKAVEWGHVHLVMDGAALIRGLTVHSNTTIECLDKECGFYLMDDCNCALLINSQPSYADRRSRNITLIGGTYNHNCLHQLHDIPCNDSALTSESPDNGGVLHLTVALEFYGVENLTVRDVTIRDQRTFAFTVGNFKHVYIENTFIELENDIPYGNQDGFHFWGPGQFLTLRNVGGRTGDDFMNVGPDERDGVSSITDVMIDGVFLDEAYQGIRLLSRGKGLLDRITIRNVTGTYRCYGFYINPWFIDDSMGNFRNIVFENIDLRPLDNVYPNPPFLFSIGGDIESLTFRNIHWYHPGDTRNIFQIGYPFYDVNYEFKDKKPIVHFLMIDGMTVIEDSKLSADTEHMILRGIIEQAVLRDIYITRPAADHPCGAMLKTKPDCEIKKLLIDRLYAENLDSIVNCEEGTIQTLCLHDVAADNLGTGFIRGQVCERREC